LGKGFGTEALKLIVDYGFKVLNPNRIELTVFDFNERSFKCYKKIGFKEEGTLRQKRYKNGRYCDEIVMSILRDDGNRMSGLKKTAPPGE
jgi:RimJ/RimL family protein N-acetyltransferase